jgi:hypothetical protein
LGPSGKKVKNIISVKRWISKYFCLLSQITSKIFSYIKLIVLIFTLCPLKW